MTSKWPLSVLALGLASILIIVPVFAQAERGKAELSTGSGSINVDYGRPSLQGRDPLSLQQDGSYWRMGKDEATTLTTPVDLSFGAAKIAKGSYTLQLLKTSANSYELVFKPKSGQGSDVTKVALKKTAAPASVELFTIELKQASSGGTFVLTWGTAQLAADFRIGK